jgi:hypothetical protein
MKPTTRIASLFLLAAAIAGCGGGGGSDAPAGTPAPAPTPSPTPAPTPPPPSSGPGTARASFFLPYKLGNETLTSRLPHLAVDAAGGIHAVYAANAVDSTGHRSAYYAYCPSNCTSTGSFSAVALSDGLGNAEIQLDAAGHPRILLHVGPDPDNIVQHQFWACDNDCLRGENWRGGVAAQAQGTFFVSGSEKTQSFALDADGRPRFVFTSNSFGAQGPSGTLFASCDALCMQSENWRVTQLGDYEWKNPALAIGSSGLPQIVYADKFVVQDPYAVLPVVNYLECTSADCSGPIHTLTLAMTADAGAYSEGLFAFRLTASGARRLALYPGSGSGGNIAANQLHYLTCDSSCTQLAQWSALDLALPAGHGEHGLDLALDQQGRPRIAYRIPAPTDELAYVTCDANCNVSAQGWHALVLPSTADAEAELGLPPRMGCPDCIPPIPPCPSAFWDAGYWPELTLDRAGNPLIAYEVQLQVGGGQCTAGTLGRFSRFTTFKQP